MKLPGIWLFLPPPLARSRGFWLKRDRFQLKLDRKSFQQLIKCLID
ncbi:MAG: hypothetical protein O4861_21395 [Trichodesmium sp. St16_bin4-tuft]|nr:hypothetical protein [Trichodesmium sp. MAG_R01]MDE5072057.1 hypothetical protein [Trichodesmium sp. St5_bin8]MDE5100745.1 hypothetical protein [Trichodesmium sp. St16_bin4-tuft]MDE5102581.1 hypothetical protein [Trichodesmium sp. St19_bin2]